MGVWHTHPQDIPMPSSIDWEDWKQTLDVDKTGSEYIFFIIAGTVGTRVWVGNKNENSITEIEECMKTDGLYQNVKQK
jgi:integrative and conjugative element protein (TIGR02256 family)